MTMTDDVTREVRHALRGELHTIMLCVEAAATATSDDEQLEWLAFIDAGCDRVQLLLDRLPRRGQPGE
jgi:hypothetical protein